MSKLFYDHLILQEEIIALLDTHTMSSEEREDLLQIIDEIFHHSILNVIFNHLPKENHPEFIKRLHASPHDPAIIEFIQSKVTVNIEEEIRRHATKLKSELSSEIKKSKK